MNSAGGATAHVHADIIQIVLTDPCFRHSQTLSLCCLIFRGNIAAVGYLLFAIWLSLHASVAAHAIGVEFLLDRILAHFTCIAPEWGKGGTEVSRGLQGFHRGLLLVAASIAMLIKGHQTRCYTVIQIIVSHSHKLI